MILKKEKMKRIAAVCAGAGMMMFVLGGCGSKAIENEEAYRQIGINSMEAGDYESAVSAFQSALDERVGKITALEIDICYYKAAAQYKSGDTKGALETYTALINYDDENAQAYYLRGNIYMLEGNAKNAISDYNAAVAAAPKDYELAIGIYESLNNAGETEQAKAYLTAALEIGGSEAADLRQTGRIYYLLEDYDRAVEQLTAAINAGDDVSTLYLGEVYQEQGKSEEAQALFASYIESHGTDSEAMNEMGCLLMENGDYADAISSFEQGLAVEGAENTQELLQNVIKAYEYSGDFATAKVRMETYLESYPDDEAAQREYTFLQTR